MSYDYPPTGYPPPMPETDQKAVWALVSAIAGFVICPLVLHIVGWVLANQSMEAIRASGGRLTGDGMAKAARILSIVGLVLSALGLLFFVLIVVLGIAGSN